MNGTLVDVERRVATEIDPVWVKMLTGKPGLALAFVWGLAEGTLFFVMPDVVISLAAILRPMRVWKHVLATVVGSLLGGAMMFAWAVRSPASAHEAVDRVPFVRSGMFAGVDADYAKYGAGAMFLGPLGGIPYKVYAVEAPKFIGSTTFFVSTLPARGCHFLLAWLVFGFVGGKLRKRLKRSDGHVIAWHATFWIMLYALYWGRILLLG